MANILDKFKNTSVGSSGRILDFLSKINASGNFSILYDLDVIINSWSNILTTPKRTYDHDPEFGSNLYLYLFEPADNETSSGIKDEIFRSLTTFDDRASIDTITVDFLKNTEINNTIEKKCYLQKNVKIVQIQDIFQ